MCIHIMNHGGDKINKIQLVFHIVAILAIIGGIYRAVTASTPELSSSLMSQYILWAILFIVISFNFKNYKK